MAGPRASRSPARHRKTASSMSRRSPDGLGLPGVGAVPRERPQVNRRWGSVPGRRPDTTPNGSPLPRLDGIGLESQLAGHTAAMPIILTRETTDAGKDP